MEVDEKTYPDQGVNTKSGIPGGVNDIVTRFRSHQLNDAGSRSRGHDVLKPFLVACTIQTDVSAIEPGSDILEFALEGRRALT